MDKIILKDMVFYAYHGVNSEENIQGQRFAVDMELLLDLQQAGQSDAIEDTVSYAQIYKLTAKIVTENVFKLLEALAEKIAGEILDKFDQVQEINVTVKKPQAPVNGMFDYFGVEIRRSRQ